MASDSYHEPVDLLSDATKNLHRAIVSLMEELEAIDWYQQRAEATPDADLRAVLVHNKNEEVEHAMMTLEWIRRHDPEFDRSMRTYLFTEGAITELEKEAEKEGGSPPSAGSGGGGSLSIGSLRR